MNNLKLQQNWFFSKLGILAAERKSKNFYKVLVLLMLFGQVACSSKQLSQLAQEKILPFASIYEPSGIVYVGEGEFLLVEDEPEKPIHRVSLDTNRHLHELGQARIEGAPISLDDLEGISYDGKYVYAITSHTQGKNAVFDSDRAVLVRFEYQDGVLFKPRIIRDLKQRIVLQLWPLLSDLSMNEISEKINIEALAWFPPTKRLLIGFRAPLVAGKSLIVGLENLDALFENQSAENAHVTINWLALDNNRIRAMSWDEHGQQLLVVAGRKRSGKRDYVLWKWSGRAGIPPLKINGAESALPARTEGLTTVNQANINGVLIVIDDGKKKKNLAGHYQFISREKSAP
jgi:hypothetical protein